jgi:hypothetical protein
VAGNPCLPLSSSCQVQPLGAPLRAASARASRSARIGWARQYESIASRGVGGTKGRLRAQDRTADGKMPGNALLRRASDRRFLSAFSACHLDIFGLPPGEKQLVPRTPSKKAATRPGIDQEALVSFGLSPPSIPIFPNVLELLSQKGANFLQCADLSH